MIPTFDELVSWANGQLLADGQQLVGAAEEVKERTWGRVVRIPTEVGDFYAKATCDGLAVEAPLVQVLAEVVPDKVVRVVATDDERGWMVLADGGAVLGESYSTKQWRDALVDYAVMQRRVEPHAERLLALGVLDARPQSLLDRWDELLEHPGLRRDLPTGTTAEDLDRLNDLRPRLQAKVAELEQGGVAMTIQHDDVHPWNVFFDSRVFDWGDAAISHPFGSLQTALQFLTPPEKGEPDPPEKGEPDPPESVELINSNDDFVRSFSDAYLDVWSDVAPAEVLREQARLALVFAPIGRALNWGRIPGAGDHFDEPAMAAWLRKLLQIAELYGL